ncbi:aminotransferase class IV family protein [Actinophytocola sp.]|uniref:aminotransferase class IV family protein n=1 Tax=Actinophytocola sp. TaxID=1872138 RepID=UPI002EDB6544
MTTLPDDLTDDLRTLAMVNYGHFTSMRVDGGRVRGLGLHLERLDRDAREVFGRGLDADLVRARVREAVEGRDGPLYAKVNVFARDLDPDVDEHEPSLLVTVRPLPARAGSPLRVGTVAYERDLPQVKHVGTFGLFHQSRLARRRGFDDALFVNRDGEISEGSAWNVGFLDGDTVVWPSAPALPGVAMHLLRDALTARGVPVETRPVTPADLPRFRAAFASNALAPVQVLGSVDDVRFPGDEAVARLLAEAYEEIPGEVL